MQHFDYKPHGVCPMNISFDLDGDTVHNVSFKGGCNGNLQAISRVVEGMTVEQIEGYFKGISCNGRGTSSSDQLATAVRKAKESEYEKHKKKNRYFKYRFFLRVMGWIDAVKQ